MEYSRYEELYITGKEMMDTSEEKGKVTLGGEIGRLVKTRLRRALDYGVSLRTIKAVLQKSNWSQYWMGKELETGCHSCQRSSTIG